MGGRGNKDFRYSSTGIPSTITGYGNWNGLDSSNHGNSAFSENCAAVTSTSNGMDDKQCSDLVSSVCELEWKNNAIDQADGLTDKVLEQESVIQQLKISVQELVERVLEL